MRDNKKIVVEPTGAALSGMLRAGGVERSAAIAIVRAKLAESNSTVITANNLGMKLRLLQQWLVRFPSMSAGLPLIGRGRPAGTPSEGLGKKPLKKKIVKRLK